MILLVIGTQLPFDRLVKAADDWCMQNGVQMFGQIGQTKYRPKSFAHAAFLDPLVMEEKFDQADLVVAHAGVGSIVTALTKGKPIIVMPRRASLGEHRNDHQMATVERFRGLAGLSVAWDEIDLVKLLDWYQSPNHREKVAKLSPFAGTEFTDAIRELLQTL